MSGREHVTAAARLASLSDDGLAAVLADLGRSLVVPQPADLPGSVTRRLEESRTAARASRVARPRWLRDLAPGDVPLRRALVLAVIAVVVLAGVAAALGIGLPGIRIFFGPGPSAVPSAGASASAVAAPSGAIPGAGLSLGRPVAFAEAQAVADYPIGVPGLAGLGPPDAVWLDTSGPGPVVTLVWGPRAGATAVPGVGLLLSEIPGSINTTFFEKFVGQGTRVQPAVVGDGGWWITGALHEVAVVGANGDVRFETIRLSGNVLLWSSGRVTFRLETSLDEPRALEIARSVR
jgi:hypothetical protein